MTHEFKSGYSYYVDHIPSGESWQVLGIDIKGDRVCAAGWPPTIGKLSDCTNIEVMEPLTEEELKYRAKEFGENWI